MYKTEIERWISTILEHVTVDDLLGMLLTYDGEMIFDLESMRKILSGFMENKKSVPICNTGDFRESLLNDDD
ncbi:hypothetical protein ACFX1Z_024426 [Malus domestica]